MYFSWKKGKFKFKFKHLLIWHYETLVSSNDSWGTGIGSISVGIGSNKSYTTKSLILG